MSKQIKKFKLLGFITEEAVTKICDWCMIHYMVGNTGIFPCPENLQSVSINSLGLIVTFAVNDKAFTTHIDWVTMEDHPEVWDE